MAYLSHEEYSNLLNNFKGESNPSKKLIKEYFFDDKYPGQGNVAQMYPNDKGPFENKNLNKENLDFTSENPMDFKNTDKTIQTVEEETVHYDFSSLPPDKRKQLKEYIASVKEIKKAIKEILNKTKKSTVEESKKKHSREDRDEKVPEETKATYKKYHFKKSKKLGGDRTGEILKPNEIW